MPKYTYPVTGGYTLFIAPGDIATIYDITPLYNSSPAIDGTGQTLAVMGQTDVYLSDINDFRSGFSLPVIPVTGSGSCTTDANGLIILPCNTTNLQYVLVNADPHQTASLSDLQEADLDLEWSGATARNAQIIYVNAPDPTGNGVLDSWYYAVDHNVAPVITLSYGFCEFDEAQNGAFASDEKELQMANTEGITFMNSSGDSGAAECDPPQSNPNETLATLGLAVSYPASSPEVTGVGGTMIPNGEYNNTYWNTVNGSNGGSALSYIPENGWNDDSEFGAYCIANPTDPFCTSNGITNAQTAQAAFGFASTGGGPSNCVTETGGVCATINGGFAQPSWQTVTITGQTSARFTPDVSLLASANWPGYIWCSNGSCASGIPAAVGNDSITGGTSASSPIFAGIVTLLNQYAVQNGFQNAPGFGNVNPNLYQIAIYNPSAFHHVTAGLNAPGSNTVYCQTGAPAGQPAALQCPAAVKPATEGIFGYFSANADATTGYNLVTGLGSVNANNLATAWGELLTASTTSLSPSAANIIQGQSETLTITVTPSSASGVVNLFSNGSTTPLSAPRPVTGGTGTFTTTSLPVGTNSITGTYTGTNASSTSSAVIVNVAPPTFTLATSGSTSHTVLAGQKTQAYSFTATPTSPTGSPAFTSAVTFGCTFAPTDTTLTNASCAFTPASIPAGTTGATAVSMTIMTAGPNTGTGSRLRRRADNRPPWLPLTLPIAGVVMLGLMRGKVSRKVSKRSAIALLFFSLALLGFMVACGGGSSSPPPPPPVGITVTPNTAVNLYFNEAGNTWPATATQQQFTAAVTNATNTAVSWQVNGVSGGNATFGTITSAGLYTAPATLPSPTSFNVTAIAQADTTKTASDQVNILTPTAVGTFTVTVTATESSAVQSQPVTLVVQ